MSRISVIGGPGTGKTSFASRAAAIVEAPHVELDALWWGPKWTPVDLTTFQTRVRAAVTGSSWVIEGYYVDEAARPLIWPAADTIVWLDLPRSASVARAVRRSAIRVVRRTDLWSTNRQSARVLTPWSIVSFIRRWPGYRARIEAALATERVNGRTVVRLRTDGEKAAWLARLAETRQREPGAG